MHNSESKTRPKEPNPPAQIVREREKQQRRRRISGSPLGSLQMIADHLNSFADGYYPTPEREWELAKTIVEAKSLAKKIGRFNSEAEKVDVRLWIEKKGKAPRPSETSDDQKGAVLLHLWRYYFRDEGWIRLKQCLKCKEWFVDATLNKSAVRCSAGCNWAWWSRKRRAEKNHKHQKKAEG